MAFPYRGFRLQPLTTVAGEIVTGVLYVEPEPTDLHDYLNVVDKPLSQLIGFELCPGR